MVRDGERKKERKAQSDTPQSFVFQKHWKNYDQFGSYEPR